MAIAPPSVGGGGQGGGRAGGPRTVASSPADLARLERTARNLEALYRGAGQAGTAVASLAREMGAMTVQARAGAVGVREFTDALRGLQGQLRQGLAAASSARDMTAAAPAQRPSSFGTVVASAALASGLAATLGGSIPLELISARREVTAERTPRPPRMDGLGQSRSRDRNRAARRDDVKAGIDLNTASREDLVGAGIGLGEKKVEPFLASRAARPFDSIADVRARKLGVTADALDKLPEPSLTAGQQVAKDFAQQTKDLARQVELARERAKLLSTRAGAQSLAEQVRLTRELEAAQRRLDPLGAKKPGGGGGGGGGFADFAAASQQGFVAASAGILALTSAANPLAINTFRASVEGLAISVGGSLGPGMMQVSGYVQRFADWIDRLDPALKSNVASVALWSTGVLGAAFAVTKLVAGLRLVGTVLSVGMMGPIGATVVGLTALVGTVGVLTNGFGLLENRARGAGGAINEAGRANVGGWEGSPRAGPRRALSEEMIDRLPPEVARQVREAGGEGNVLTVLRAYQTRAGGEVDAARRRETEALGGGDAERRAARRLATERVDMARPIYEMMVEQEQRVAGGVDPRTGVARPGPVGPERRELLARQAAEGVLPRHVMGPDRVAARQAMGDLLQGGPFRDRPSQSSLAAQRERERAEANQRVVNDLLGRLAGADDPRLSLKWLPQSRQFSEMTGYSEYLQGQSLQPMGAQDIVNEIARLRNVTETLGGILDKVKDNTGEQGPLVRALGGW